MKTINHDRNCDILFLTVETVTATRRRARSYGEISKIDISLKYEVKNLKMLPKIINGCLLSKNNVEIHFGK